MQLGGNFLESHGLFFTCARRRDRLVKDPKGALSQRKSRRTHGSNDGNSDLLAILESGFNVLAEFSFGDLDVVLGSSVLQHQVQEALKVDKGSADVFRNVSSEGPTRSSLPAPTRTLARRSPNSHRQC